VNPTNYEPGDTQSAATPQEGGEKAPVTQHTGIYPQIEFGESGHPGNVDPQGVTDKQTTEKGGLEGHPNP